MADKEAIERSNKLISLAENIRPHITVVKRVGVRQSDNYQETRDGSGDLDVIYGLLRAPREILEDVSIGFPATGLNFAWYLRPTSEISEYSHIVRSNGSPRLKAGDVSLVAIDYLNKAMHDDMMIGVVRGSELYDVLTLAISLECARTETLNSRFGSLVYGRVIKTGDSVIKRLIEKVELGMPDWVRPR